LHGPPILTVALPTCNGSRHLREALAGLKLQGEVDFDATVCDDRSDDDTVAIARDELGDRGRIFINPERLGLAGNWNRCVDRSRTEWVAIFHQDDVMRPGHLARHLGLIASAPSEDVGLVAGDVAMIDEEGNEIPRRYVDPGGLRGKRQSASGTDFPPGWSRLLATSNPFRCSAVTTRKAAHAAVGGFDPSYHYAVDWDFWARVSVDWGLIWGGGPSTVAMRWHPASETHRFKTGTIDLDEQIRLLHALHESLGLGHSARTRADRRLARAFLNRAHVALKGGDSELARECLGRAMKISPRVLGWLASDPRLAVQMSMLSLAPGLARRLFGRRLPE